MAWQVIPYGGITQKVIPILGADSVERQKAIDSTRYIIIESSIVPDYQIFIDNDNNFFDFLFYHIHIYNLYTHIYI